MYDNQLDYRAIQRRADATVKQQQLRTRRGLFAVNVLLYAICMAFTWGFFFMRGVTLFVFGALIVISALWTVGVILHGASLWLTSESATRRMHERAVAPEIQQEMQRLNLDNDEISPGYEKAKRQSRLSDEAGVSDELVDFIDKQQTFSEDMP